MERYVLTTEQAREMVTAAGYRSRTYQNDVCRWIDGEERLGGCVEVYVTQDGMWRTYELGAARVGVFPLHPGKARRWLADNGIKEGLA